MTKRAKHIDKDQIELIERRKDRHVKVFLGISTLLGPLLGVVAQFLLDLI